MKSLLIKFVVVALGSLAVAQLSLDQLFTQVSQNAPQASSASSTDVKVNLGYRADPTISAQMKTSVLDGLIAELKKRGRWTVQNEAKLREAFAKLNVTNAFRDSLKKLKLIPEDMAAAMGVFVVTSFQILNGGAEYPDTTSLAVYNQFKRSFAKIHLAQISSVDRQKFCEALYWVAFMNATDFDNAQKGLPGYTAENVKDSVTQTLVRYKLDPARFTITKQGLSGRQ